MSAKFVFGVIIGFLYVKWATIKTTNNLILGN